MMMTRVQSCMLCKAHVRRMRVRMRMQTRHDELRSAESKEETLERVATAITRQDGLGEMEDRNKWRVNRRRGYASKACKGSVFV